MNNIKSMTGYGKHSEIFKGTEITAEIRSVNNRFLEVTVKVPSSLRFLENELRKLVSKYAFRGKIEVFITLNKNIVENNQNLYPALNEGILSYYDSLVKDICQKYKYSEMETLKLLNFPGVLSEFQENNDLSAEEKSKNEKIMLENVTSVFIKAAENFQVARLAEGENLKKALIFHTLEIEASVLEIEKYMPSIQKSYEERLYSKVLDSIKNIISSAARITEHDKSRIITEVAVFSDKIDTYEETVRIKSHCCAIKSILESDDNTPAGKKIEFLIQELARESNTITSKSKNLQVTALALKLKNETEKLREQIQNIE